MLAVLQALLALPAITPPMLAQFEVDVAATGSEKEQRFIIRKLLMQSGTPYGSELGACCCCCSWAHSTGSAYRSIQHSAPFHFM